MMTFAAVSAKIGLASQPVGPTVRAHNMSEFMETGLLALGDGMAIIGSNLYSLSPRVCMTHTSSTYHAERITVRRECGREPGHLLDSNQVASAVPDRYSAVAGDQ
jgi:hypothetical protein